MSEMKSDLTAAAASQPEVAAAPGGAMLPRVDVFEDETGITLLADVPGVAKE